LEGILNHLWERFRTDKVAVVILFFIVLFGVLGFVALVSDIGFSDEVKKYRYTILYSATGLAILYVLIWAFIFIIQENRGLKHQITSLRQKVADKEGECEAASKLANQRSEDITHLRQTILNLIQEITVGRVVEVINVQYYKERLYISIKKAEEKLSLGDEIRVIDTEEGYVMGVFEVSEERDVEYIARSTAYISPMWMGYIHQMGNAESSAPPGTMAIIYPKDTDKHE
jgi:uncharacterized protein YuzE